MSPVCINEDLYYATQLHVPGSSMAIAMISFSLKTEAFVSYQIPDTSVSRHSHCETGPFNIRGKVGISFADEEQDNHKIWVLEDVKDNKWSLLLLNIHPSIQDVNRWVSQRPPSFRGLTKNGGMVYAKAQQKDLAIWKSLLREHIYQLNNECIQS
ncbi:hypothetical protein Bca4012_046193 [Brassica carinata]